MHDRKTLGYLHVLPPLTGPLSAVAVEAMPGSGYTGHEAMGHLMGKGLRGLLQRPYGLRDLQVKIQEALEA